MHTGTKIAYSEEEARRSIVEAPAHPLLASHHARNVRAEVYNAKGALVLLFARDASGEWKEIRG